MLYFFFLCFCRAETTDSQHFNLKRDLRHDFSPCFLKSAEVKCLSLGSLAGRTESGLGRMTPVHPITLLTHRSTVNPHSPRGHHAQLIVVVQAFAADSRQQQSGMGECLILVAKKLTWWLRRELWLHLPRLPICLIDIQSMWKMLTSVWRQRPVSHI